MAEFEQGLLDVDEALVVGEKLKKGSLDDHQSLKRFMIIVVSRDITHSSLRDVANLIEMYVSHQDSHQRYLIHLHSY